MKACASLTEILHKFLVQLGVVGSHYTRKLVQTITAFKELLNLVAFFGQNLSYYFFCCHFVYHIYSSPTYLRHTYSKQPQSVQNFINY